MIGKVFFTMLVIVVVGMLFRSKGRTQNATQTSNQATTNAQGEAGSLAPKTVAYMLVGLLIIVSGLVYYYSWSDANRLINLQVISANGTMSHYQAYHKDIDGREFTSVDGILIKLADSDRLEILLKQ